jgi:hypothetical protein
MKNEEVRGEFAANFERIDKELARRQEMYCEEAVRLGYARTVVDSTARLWLGAMAGTGQPLTMASALDSTYAFANELSDLNKREAVGKENIPVYSGALIFATTTGSAIGGASSRGVSCEGYEELFVSLRNDDSYVAKLSSLNAPLGVTYRSINEVLYGTTSDPVRGSLYLIRQAFDQLFAVLAPDEEVRMSRFWTPKEGEKKDHIYRLERIEYALDKHVKIASRADSLAANAKQMLELYQALNEAHSREAVEEYRCKDAIRAMKLMLESWTDAIM